MLQQTLCFQKLLSMLKFVNCQNLTISITVGNQFLNYKIYIKALYNSGAIFCSLDEFVNNPFAYPSDKNKQTVEQSVGK